MPVGTCLVHGSMSTTTLAVLEAAITLPLCPRAFSSLTGGGELSALKILAFNLREMQGLFVGKGRGRWAQGHCSGAGLSSPEAPSRLGKLLPQLLERHQLADTLGELPSAGENCSLMSHSMGVGDASLQATTPGLQFIIFGQRSLQITM